MRHHPDPGLAGPVEARAVIERIDELLEVTYRSADLGNMSDPLAELVYILLSQQTREAIYRRVFADIRATFDGWMGIIEAPLRHVQRVLRPAGFQRRRAKQLRALLRAVLDDNLARGVGPAARPARDLTLSYITEMEDGEAERFLINLPGIGPKSARCVLAYSLDRPAFPVDTHVHRIFTRMRLLGSRGRKKDHDPFQNVVPGPMRKRLHINLVHHGRAVCRSQNPRCGDCVLVSFCAQGRRRIGTMRDRPVAIDLFGGAGGLGTGFIGAGFRVALAVELNRHAAQTYRVNNPGVPVIEDDVRKLTAARIRQTIPGLRNPKAVLAGPPCQGYSAAGAREPSDPRNLLFKHVTRVAHELRSRFVVIENVPGLRKVNGQRFLHRIEASLRARGYSHTSYLLRACDFGVPQDRLRYFILARRGGSGRLLSEPEPTHRPPEDIPSNGRAQTPTLIEALDGLPLLGPGVRAEWIRTPRGTYVGNASTMRHSKAVVSKIRRIRPGKGPISYRRLERDLARTLVAGHRALPVHPTRHRTISVREAARIQGFQDSYFFCGPPAEQPLQVANAVPPPLAQAVAEHILTHG